MSYRCLNPEGYAGKVVANGQCVRFVQACARAPDASAWKEGVRVRRANLRAGTAIATFVHGKYPNLPHGNHAAIYIGQDATGIWVWEQWQGSPVHQRHILFKHPDSLDRSNNGNSFSVIE